MTETGAVTVVEYVRDDKGRLTYRVEPRLLILPLASLFILLSSLWSYFFGPGGSVTLLAVMVGISTAGMFISRIQTSRKPIIRPVMVEAGPPLMIPYDRELLSNGVYRGFIYDMVVDIWETEESRKREILDRWTTLHKRLIQAIRTLANHDEQRRVKEFEHQEETAADRQTEA